MLYLAYDFERDGQKSDQDNGLVGTDKPAPERSSDADLEAVLENLLDSLEDLNLLLAKAYIETVERRRSKTSEKQS
jgi:hypothetical protein